MSPVYRAFPAQPVLGPTFTSGSANGPNGSTCPRPPYTAASRRCRGDAGDFRLCEPVLKHGPSTGCAGKGP